MTIQALTEKPGHREQKQINLRCPGSFLSVIMLTLSIQGFAQETVSPKLPEEIVVNAPEAPADPGQARPEKNVQRL
jgi:hypothetical protein